MKRILLIIILILGISKIYAKKLPETKYIIACMERVNDDFMNHHNPADDSIRIPQTYPSNVWTRSIYFEGLMALNNVSPQSRYLEYALIWSETNKWNFYGGMHTLNSDNQCCAQTYIDLYRLYGNPQYIENVERLLNNVVNNTTHNDWKETRAIHTAMPVYARMGAIKKDLRYFEKMTELYRHIRNRVGLYNTIAGLWWQSAIYMPPCKEPNGKNCYWSISNGWALTGLARTIDEIDTALPDFTGENLQKLQSIRKSLADDFVATAMAVAPYQREDGFWNSSLTAPLHYDGPENPATALFLYGMAWGIRKQLLSSDLFLPTILKGWAGLTEKSVRKDSDINSTPDDGKESENGQPAIYKKNTQDGTDFGIGCFLLAGSEIIRLLSQ